MNKKKFQFILLTFSLCLWIMDEMMYNDVIISMK